LACAWLNHEPFDAQLGVY